MLHFLVLLALCSASQAGVSFDTSPDQCVAPPQPQQQTPSPSTVTAANVALVQEIIMAQLHLVPSFRTKCNNKVAPCPLGHIFGGLVRLAFHDAAGAGGPNGCLDFRLAEHTGLKDIIHSLEEIYWQTRPLAPWLSRADLWYALLPVFRFNSLVQGARCKYCYPYGDEWEGRDTASVALSLWKARRTDVR
jgi:hypothetical protein